MRKKTDKQRHWFLLIGVVGIIVIFGLLTNVQEPPPQLTVGTKAPDFRLKTLDGDPVRLSDYEGRPVLVNFWASWCPPCWVEAPALEKAYQEHKSDGFVILAISLSNDSLSGAISFKEHFDITFPLLVDENSKVERMYQLQGLPASYFVGRDGIIKHTFAGPAMTEEQVNRFVSTIMEQ